MTKKKPGFEKNAARDGAALTFEQIGDALGISSTTASRAFVSGIKKLDKAGTIPLIIDCIHAIATEDKDIFQAGSVECRKEWIAENAHGTI